MIQKKVCMLGSFAVGKTSLVQRFVRSIFSDKYLTTVGVKIDKKIVAVQEQEVNLLLWDLAGEDEFYKVPVSYLRGSSGYLVVVDGTRGETLEAGIQLLRKAESATGQQPTILLLNKDDLTDEWEIDDIIVTEYEQSGFTIFRTSAKTGKNVETAFIELATKILKKRT